MNTDPRSDEELNRIIAEWCGWKLIPSHDIYISGQLQAVPEEWETPNGDYHDDLPNYTGDLNACHEAENKWCDRATIPNCYSFEYTYEQSLRKATWMAPFRATARQRAEALVRVIEKEGK